ncbi:MAG: 16S rRNA (adenine(1518)-N(6)/adenine(1519)-N(6))-dimethyltransferase RsmA [Phycisphaerales bacterium JB037]
MQTLAEIRGLLESHGLSPRHRLGQCFLIDRNLVAKLVDSAGVGPGEVVLEVGPGTGTLTDTLLERGARVVACELDAGLCGLLRDRLGGEERFTLVEGDCLARKSAVNPEILEAIARAQGLESGRAPGPFKLVANLPYGAATPLMIALLVEHPACVGQWVTIQREVGERLMAGPGMPGFDAKAYGPISVLAWAAAECRVIATPGPECFWPRPEVDSVMLQIRRKDHPACADLAGLARFCQRLFATRRKQLGGVLGRGLVESAGIDPTARVEAVEPARLVELFERARDAEPAPPPPR